MQTWPPPGPALRDDRLVFLAARPYLDRWAHPWWAEPFRALSRQLTHAGTRHAGGRRSGRGARPPAQPRPRPVHPEAGKLARYALACDVVREGLDEGELRHLRATGELPRWFLPAVRKEARRLRLGRG